MTNNTSETRALNKKKLEAFEPQALDPKYQKWLQANYPNTAELDKMAQTIQTLDYQPLISIIIPV
ncbi:MAG: hypothetical protein AAFU84_11695, partial [Cyanobacteria bacterium J06633_23]